MSKQQYFLHTHSVPGKISQKLEQKALNLPLPTMWAFEGRQQNLQE